MINSKKKGAAGEREFANYCKAMGFDVRRTAQYNGKELDSKADVIGIPGVHIEVKRVEALNINFNNYYNVINNYKIITTHFRNSNNVINIWFFSI